MRHMITLAIVGLGASMLFGDVDIAYDAETEEEKVLIDKTEFDSLTNAACLAQTMWHRFNEIPDMRLKMHGKVIREEVDIVNMVKRYYYEDGYVYVEPFHKKETKAQEYGIGDPTSKAQQQLEKDMPERLKEIRRHRRKKLATTNEVTIVNRGGLN